MSERAASPKPHTRCSYIEPVPQWYAFFGEQLRSALLRLKPRLGIDISKRDFHVCFLRKLKKQKMTSGKTLIGMEATGSYHLPVAYRCTQSGYTVNVINPLITRKQNQTGLRRVKTDSSDARVVRYCLMNGAGYPFCETAETIRLNTGETTSPIFNAAPSHTTEG